MFRLLRFTLGPLAVIACSRDNGLSAEPPAPCPAIIGITLRPASAIFSVGDTVRFTARLLSYQGSPCVGAELDVPFEWSTSDSTVARVTPDSGMVIGQAPGTAVLTARLLSNRNFAAGSQLTVTP